MAEDDKLREELKKERKSKTKSKKEETTEETPLIDELDIINTITGVKKVADAIKEESKKSKEEKEEQKAIEEEETKEAERLKMVIDILMEDIENEKGPEEKASLKKQLMEKVSVYLQLKKLRGIKETENLKTGINWEKVAKVLGVALKELGPIAYKIIIALLTKNR